jgi:MFS family permease
MNSKQYITKQLRLFSLFKLFKTMAFAIFGIVYTVRMVSVFGLSNEQVMLLNAFYYFTSMIMEVPTGYFSDYFGHKKSIVISSLMWSLAMAIYCFGGNYTAFVIAEIICALATAFCSGALDAWLGAKFECQDQYDAFNRKLEQRYRFIAIVVVFGSGYLAKYFGYDIPFFASAICFGLSALVSFGFDSQSKEERLEISKPDFGEIFRFFTTSPRIVIIALISMSNMLWLAPVFMLWSPLLTQDLKLDATWLGYVSCALSLGLFCGGYCEQKIIDLLKVKPMVTVVAFQVFKGLTILTLANCLNDGVFKIILAFFLFEMIHGADTQFTTLLANKYWRGRSDEATISSCFSLIVRLGGGIGNLFLGGVADHMGRQNCWYLVGVMMILSSFIIPILVALVMKSKPKNK